MMRIFLPVFLAIGTGFFGGILYAHHSMGLLTDAEILSNESLAWDESALSTLDAATDESTYKLCQAYAESQIYWAPQIKRFQELDGNGSTLKTFKTRCKEINNVQTNIAGSDIHDNHVGPSPSTKGTIFDSENSH